VSWRQNYFFFYSFYIGSLEREEKRKQLEKLINKTVTAMDEAIRYICIYQRKHCKCIKNNLGGLDMNILVYAMIKIKKILSC
jgi:hypothetical protein